MTTENTERATPETDAFWKDMNTGNYQPSWWVVAERMRDHAKRFERKRDEALRIGQELADISSHCLGWHIDVAGNFKSDHTLDLSRKITHTLQRWGKLKEAVK
jgi:hypothetical protein